MSYKTIHSLEKRRAEGLKMSIKFPDRIPVIVEKAPKSRLNDLDNHKYLVLHDQTIAAFLVQIRKKIDLRSEESLFFFINDTIPASMTTMGKLYEEHKDEDGFMYLVYSEESVYGGDEEPKAKKPFKDSYTLEERVKKAQKLLQKSPDLIPIIVEPAENCRLPILPTRKMVSPRDLVVGQFQWKIRKAIDLRPEEALFFFINNTIPATMATMGQVYEEHKEEDGFLYVTYSEESVYGGDDKPYKKAHTFEERLAKGEKILQKHPDRIPVIVEKASKSRLENLPGKKFLVTGDTKVGQFQMQIREKIKLRPEESLFFFINDTIPATMSSMKDLYEMHKDPDHFMYLTYSEESVYGAEEETPKPKTPFKQAFSFEDRRLESEKMIAKYPDRVPVVVEKAKHSRLTELQHQKFLAMGTITVHQFLMQVREKIKLRPEESVYFLVDDTMPSGMSTMKELYERFEDQDGFLYLTYCEENVYGGGEGFIKPIKTLKESATFEQRLEEAEKLMEEHKFTVPVVLERAPHSRLSHFPIRKLLVPLDVTVFQIVCLIREKIKLRSDETLFFFVGNTIPGSMTMISNLYKDHKDADKFLYITYSEENVYGGTAAGDEPTTTCLEKKREKPANYITVVVEKSEKSKLPSLERAKFSVSPTMTIGEFQWKIRKRINLRPEDGLFFFVNDVIPGTMMTMQEIHEAYKDPQDKYIYLTYCEESVYGANEPTRLYKDEFCLEQRVWHQQHQKVPGYIQLILQKAPDSKFKGDWYNRLNVPGNHTLQTVQWKIRERLNFDADVLFFLNNTRIPDSGKNMEEFYEENKEEDGFMYWTYRFLKVYEDDEEEIELPEIFDE